MKSKINYFTIIAIVLVVAFFLVPFCSKDINTVIQINFAIAVITVIASIAAIIFAKKIEKSKILPIILLVASLLGLLVFGLLTTIKDLAKDPEKNGEICKTLVNCKKGDKISTCYVEGDNSKTMPFKCYTENLKEEQFK